MKVYGLPRLSHFGDVWLFISGAIIQSKVNQEVVYLSKYAIKDFNRKYSFEKIILECLSLLDDNGVQIKLVEDLDNQATEGRPDLTYWAKNTYIPYYAAASRNSPVSTKIKHKKNIENNSVSLQISSYYFDQEKKIYTSPKTSWNKDLRDIPHSELEKIYLNLMSFDNIKIHLVGEHIGLKKSIEKISESKIFIGIDSGMAHVAASVGLPIYLHYWTESEENNVFVTNFNKKIKTFNNFDDIYRILQIHNINI